MPFDAPSAPFAGYIFDCDGTLADTMPLHFEAWKVSLREHGFEPEFPEPLFYSWGGVPTPKIVGRINAHFGTRLDVDAVFHTKEEVFRRISVGVRPIEPVVAWARQVKATHPISVASGGPRRVVLETLERIGIRDWFPVVVTAEDVEHGKPSPDMFLLAAARMQVEPAQVLVFEDAEPGRQAAIAAGMTYVMVDARRMDSARPPAAPGV